MNESWELEARETQLPAFESTSNIDENRPIRRSGKPCHDKTLLPLKQAAAGVSQPFASTGIKAMKCIELQSNLALYADGLTEEAESSTVKAHLDACPICRQHYAEFREIRGGLQQLRRPEISAALQNSIKQNIRTETQSSAWLPFAPDIREWLLMRVMPYGVGVLASVMIGVTFLTVLFSGMLNTQTVPMAMHSASSMMIASNRNPLADYDIVISPREYAQTRLAFANESPSINPQGALIAMTGSLARSGRNDDELVVVADIYGNGSAEIAEVVEPSLNRRAVAQLEKALYTASADAPFVPASMENRPDSVRVVLKFQSVNVKTDPKRNKL